uniref:Uncharacterized protein n=1 Tax=Arundo donax TaxID=35708 RepID=A0A0A8YKC4_ARUDO
MDSSIIIKVSKGTNMWVSVVALLIL